MSKEIRGIRVRHFSNGTTLKFKNRRFAIFKDTENESVNRIHIKALTSEVGKEPGIQTILSPNENDEGVWIHQDAWFHLGKFDKGVSTEYNFKKKGNGLYIFVLKGDISVNGQALNTRDGYGVWNTDKVEIKADSDAEYEEVVDVDLSAIRPTVAFPHLPGNAKTVDEIEAMDKIYIDQVVIGSCTNGRMEDLRKAAAILKGKKVADNVRVMVVPATQKIYLQCILEGILETFVEAGCAVNTPSCGPCMGGHMGVLAKGEKCVSTTNRNFVGRMGDVESLIYLASPETAAASAIAGYIANPEKFGGNN